MQWSDVRMDANPEPTPAREPGADRYLGVKDTFDQALADFAAAMPTGPGRTQSS
jgi:hypothetical protein